ncbi:MAG: GtrA family protein [Cellvibrionales bacterium]|nr:GtrA family protein [Cellvibrionales bacterium]
MLKTLFSHQLFRFAVVGGGATLVHVFVYFILFNQLAVIAHLANGMAWSLAAVYSYLGQRYWTFGNSTVKNEGTAKLRFILSSLMSLLVNAGFAHLFSYLYPSLILTLLAMGLVTPVLTFILMKYWVFSENQDRLS